MIRKRIHYCHMLILLLSPLLCSGVRIKWSKRDITTPIATIPTITIPKAGGPAPPPSVTSAARAGSWCVASEGASRGALQAALDFACGRGGADCGPIQRGGGCYEPDTLRAHASYAFNAYFHRNPLPNSCNFGGTAVTTSTNPSTGTCQYPSTSTSSSVLNTTNSSGSTIFGAVPSRRLPPPSPSSKASKSVLILRYLFTMTCLMFFL